MFSFVYDYFVLILDEAVLALGRLYRRYNMVFDDDVDWNKANRHQAYRQFMMWTHGRLGAGDRRVLCGGLGTGIQTLLAKRQDLRQAELDEKGNISEFSLITFLH